MDKTEVQINEIARMNREIGLKEAKLEVLNEIRAVQFADLIDGRIYRVLSLRDALARIDKLLEGDKQTGFNSKIAI